MTTSHANVPATESQPPLPTIGPKKPLIKARFTELVALNFHVDPAILQPRVPRGLELDFYKNETDISLVAMMLRDVRVHGVIVGKSTKITGIKSVSKDVNG